MSAQQFFHNSISSTLAAGTSIGGTSLTIADAVFPAVTAPDFYMAALEPVGGGSIEIIKVVAVSGTTLTVERAQEGSTGAAYNSGDLIQLRNTAGSMARLGQKSEIGAAFPFQTTVVTSPLILYIDPAGSDTTGDGSSGAPWASLYKAMEEAQYLRFGVNGSLTIQCADGTYPMDAQLAFNHPQGSKITVTGTPGTFTFPTGMPTGDYSTNRESPTVPARGTNDLYNTAGTCPYSTSTGARTTLRDSDNSNNRTLLKSQAGVVFDWASAGADEPKVLISSGINLEYLNFSFPVGASGGRLGITVEEGGICNASNITTNGGARGIFVSFGGVFIADSLAITGATSLGMGISRGASVSVVNMLLVQGCFNGISVGTNATLVVGPVLISSGNGDYGAQVIQGGSFSARTTGGTWNFSGNVSYGLFVDSGGVFALSGSDLEAEGNTALGCFVKNQSNLECGGVRASGNSDGFLVQSNSHVRATGLASLITNNAGYGIKVDTGGELQFTAPATVTNNGADAIDTRSNGSVIVDAGVALTVTGNTGRVFVGDYAAKSNLGALVCDLTNVASPHLVAGGGTNVVSVAPGSGGVDAGIVYSPAFGVAGSPDGSLFSDTVIA